MFWERELHELLQGFDLELEMANFDIYIATKALNVRNSEDSIWYIILSKLDEDETNWLRMSAWNSSKENIILIHGYAGGDDILPMVVLRDAYLTQGEYNVFVVDWSTLSSPPC